LGVSKGRAVEPILLGCPLLLQLWCHERFAIGWPVVPLYEYEPLPEGHDPRDRFTMGSLRFLWRVIYPHAIKKDDDYAHAMKSFIRTCVPCTQILFTHVPFRPCLVRT
jgi:hypothetical protein